MLYISTRLNVNISPILLDDSDILSFVISDKKGNKIQMVNLYNEKDLRDTENLQNRRTTERSLYSLRNTFLPNTLLVGDFNLRHPS